MRAQSLTNHYNDISILHSQSFHPSLSSSVPPPLSTSHPSHSPTFTRPSLAESTQPPQKPLSHQPEEQQVQEQHDDEETTNQYRHTLTFTDSVIVPCVTTSTLHTTSPSPHKSQPSTQSVLSSSSHHSSSSHSTIPLLDNAFHNLSIHNILPAPTPPSTPYFPNLSNPSNPRLLPHPDTHSTLSSSLSSSSSPSSSSTPSPSRPPQHSVSHTHISPHPPVTTTSATATTNSITPQTLSTHTASPTSNVTVRTVSSMTTTASLPHPSLSSDWALSVYRLTADLIHIEHPNGLGVTESTGLAAETLRFRRFRCVYISRQMHQIAMHDLHGPNAFVFRRLAGSDFLTLCRRKRCFRREFLPPRSSSSSNSGLSPSSYLPSSLRTSTSTVLPAVSFLKKSLSALRDAISLYGDALMADVHLGFTRVIDLSEQLSELPFLDDMIAHPSATPIVPANPIRSDSPTLDVPVLSLVVSYRHVTASAGRLLNILPRQWPRLLATIHALCNHVGVSQFRLWTDQMLAVRPPSGTMRWTSAALLPYTVYPVLYVLPDDDAPSPASDLSRMWIASEHLAAAFGHGLIHAGGILPESKLPKEWPSSFVAIGGSNDGIRDASRHLKRRNLESDPFYSSSEAADDHGSHDRDRKGVIATWVAASRLDMVLVVRKLVGVLLCGFVRNKSVRFAHDGQALVEWASVIASSVTYGDIGHTFSCDDCRKGLGFPADVRVLTLLGSALTIVPMSVGVLTDNETHARINVPAVRVTLNGRMWDGVREWLPECCLWGAEEDERNETWRSVLSHTKAILASNGPGPNARSLAILQLTLADPGHDGLLVAYMLVGVTCYGKSRFVGAVDWCKRFWPVDPLRMWNLYEALYDNLSDHDALLSMAFIIAASTGVDYTDIANAHEVTKINLRRVRWGWFTNLLVSQCCGVFVFAIFLTEGLHPVYGKASQQIIVSTVLMVAISSCTFFFFSLC